MGFILDTSILIATERKRFRLDDFFSTYTDQKFCISAITVSELLHGVERANARELKDKRSALMEKFISGMEVLDFNLAVARRHAALWAGLEKNGSIIGPHDLMIAATALEHAYELATLNGKEFKRVPDLRLVGIAAFSS